MYSTCLFCNRTLGHNEALERAWRDAEEIAGIADSLLLPDDVAVSINRLSSRGDEDARH